MQQKEGSARRGRPREGGKSCLRRENVAPESPPRQTAEDGHIF